MPLKFSVGPCPSCGSANSKRSHRNLLDRTLAFFLLPWRCNYCNFRFFRLRWIWTD
jgi:hypothetical protein